MIGFFCFKQKTAYDMRISDWSSDVCSSDLLRPILDPVAQSPCREGDLFFKEVLMTKHTQTTRTDQEIADLIAAETVSPAFENAFTETTGGFRMGYADEPTDADMPLPHAAEPAPQMAVRTFFDLFRDTHLEGLPALIPCVNAPSFHNVYDHL